MDDATRDLMHRAIDGEVTDAERARLQTILDGNSDAQAEWEEINRLCRILDLVEPVDPPEAWKRELLARLRERGTRSDATPTRPGAADWFRRFAAAFRPRLSPSFAFAFVAGALAGIALFATLSPWRQSLSGVDGRSVPGTLLRSSSFEAGRLEGEVQIDLEEGRIHASTRSSGRLARVEVDVRSADAAGLQIDFNPAALRLRAFDQEARSPRPIEVAAGRVQIEQPGRGRYWLWFEGAPEGALEIRIRVRSADRTLERSLPVLRDST